MKYIIKIFNFIAIGVCIVTICSDRLYTQEVNNEELLIKYFFSIPYWNDNAFVVSEREALNRGNFYRVIFYSEIRPYILEYYNNNSLQYRYIYNRYRIVEYRESYKDGIPDGYWFEYKTIGHYPYLTKRMLYDEGMPIHTTLYDYYFNGQVKMEANFKGNIDITGEGEFVIVDGISGNKPIMDGYLRRYNQRGQLAYEVYYNNGIKHGEERVFENGKIKEINYYDGVVREKSYMLFDYETGTIISSFYEEGYEEKREIFVKDELGRKIKVERFLDSATPVGIWEYYDSDGRLIRVRNYRNGLKHGEWHYYEYINDVRTIIRIDRYREDSLILSKNFYYDPEKGKRTKEESYINGLPTGEWYYYNENYQLERREIYNKGVPDGIWTTCYYLPNGQMKRQKYEIYSKGEVIDNFEVDYMEDYRYGQN